MIISENSLRMVKYEVGRVHKGAHGWIQRSVAGYQSEPDVRSLLQPWYSLVREKRQTRQEFIKAMVKSFSFSPDNLSQVSLQLRLDIFAIHLSYRAI
jgi:Sister chromatid cohesion C-terminus